MSLVKERTNFLFQQIERLYGVHGDLVQIVGDWKRLNAPLMNQHPGEMKNAYKLMYGVARTWIRKGVLVRDSNHPEYFFLLRGPRWFQAVNYMREFSGKKKAEPLYQKRIIALRQEMREMV
jgi:hypothetical protein